MLDGNVIFQALIKKGKYWPGYVPGDLIAAKQ
jgi:hypothetical protein